MLPNETTPRGGGMSGPFNMEESLETSELSCDSLNSTGFISDPTRKLVELTHLTEVRKKGLQRQLPGTEDN